MLPVQILPPPSLLVYIVYCYSATVFAGVVTGHKTLQVELVMCSNVFISFCMLFLKRMTPFFVQILQTASLREEFSCFRILSEITWPLHDCRLTWVQATQFSTEKWAKKPTFEHLTIDLIPAKKKNQLMTDKLYVQFSLRPSSQVLKITIHFSKITYTATRSSTQYTLPVN